jgi:hypothetical protein
MLFEFIEALEFTRTLPRYLDDDSYAALQGELNARPLTGVVVPGSGGVRKLRWRLDDRGKRGGLRVIYYARIAQGQIWMLAIYGKSVRENIAANVLKELKEAIEDA